MRRKEALLLLAAGWVGIVLAAAGAGAQTHALAIDGGSATNLGDFTTGYELTVETDVTLTHLGVYDGNGDATLTADVPVGLWDASHALVASATVAAGTAVDQGFFYVAVPAVALKAGSRYVVGALGNTEPFAFDRPITMGPELAFVRGLATRTNSLAEPAEIVRGTSIGNASYIGGSFKYALPPHGTPAATLTGGKTNALGPDYSVGWTWTVDHPVSVTALGVVDADGGGLGQDHTVRLYDVDADTVLATATVPAGTAAMATGGYGSHFVGLTTPVELSPGTTYLVAKQSSAHDKFLFDVVLTPGAGIRHVEGRAAEGVLPASVSGFTVTRPTGSYLGASFLYESSTVGGATLSVSAPGERTVYQRDDASSALVTVAGGYSGQVDRIEARAVPRAGYGGTPTGWQVIDASPAGGTFSAGLAVAGGWYDLEARALRGGAEVASATVGRIGVGEVFIMAGQSNSADFGKPPQTPDDDRVNAFNLSTSRWQLAADPQPFANGNGGSPWPEMGDLLAARDDVPVGVVVLGVGSTRVGQWQVGGYYSKILAALEALSETGFRAILWHQGESDSIARTSTAVYRSQLEAVIAQSRADAGWDVPWGVAIASWHPSSTADDEAAVAAAQQEVIDADPLVFRGSQTNDFHTLGYLHDSVHFNTQGLEAHARQWVDALAALPPKP